MKKTEENFFFSKTLTNTNPFWDPCRGLGQIILIEKGVMKLLGCWNTGSMYSSCTMYKSCWHQLLDLSLNVLHLTVNANTKFLDRWTVCIHTCRIIIACHALLSKRPAKVFTLVANNSRSYAELTLLLDGDKILVFQDSCLTRGW